MKEALEGLGANNISVNIETGRVEFEYGGEVPYQEMTRAIQDKVIFPRLRRTLGKMFKAGGRL